MRAIARRSDGTLKHEIEFGNDHHQVVADEPEDTGGTDEGPSPQELLAASLASCSAGWSFAAARASPSCDAASSSVP